MMISPYYRVVLCGCKNHLKLPRKPVEGRTLMNARRYVRFVVWLLTLAVASGSEQ